MIRSTKSSTLLLLLAMGSSTLALPSPANQRGPGGWSDWWNNRAGKLGGPLKGYHVRTEDTSQAWDATVQALPLDDDYRVDQKGALGDQQNQRIVADVPDAFYLYKDPADGVAPEAGYDFNGSLFDIPAGSANAGYPKTALPVSATSLFGAANANGAAKGVQILTSGGSKQTEAFAKVAADNDYMLIYFGAKWCRVCEEFTPRFMQWYAKQKSSGKKFEVVFASDDFAADFDENFRKMPWMALSIDDEQREHLILKLQTLRTSVSKLIPYVAVIDNKGQFVECDAIKGMQGEDARFPLGSAPEFFKNEIILPTTGGCSVVPEQQKRELKAWASRIVQGMSDEQIRSFAKAHNINISAVSGSAALKTYLEHELNKNIDGAQGDQLTKFYGMINNSEFYNFKVGDYVQVAECTDDRCTGYFTSDGEATILSSQVEVYQADGKRNVAQINEIVAADGAIGLKFRSNTWRQVYIKPEHFRYIEQITKEMYDNPATRSA